MDQFVSTLAVRLAQHTVTGRKSENQDTLGARIPEGAALATKGIALVMADGVSADKTGKQASQTAVASFLTDYYATPDSWTTPQSALQVIQSLNRYLYSLNQNSPQRTGHITTFSALILKGDKAFSFHVGDTRIYRYRDDELEQLTHDHAQQADKNLTYLTRALGADPVLPVEQGTYELEIGDIFILTTDGVHDCINHQLLKQLIKEADNDFEPLARGICELAIQNRSPDNLSIQICRIESRGTESQQDAVTLLSRLPFPPELQPGHHLDGLRVDKILHHSSRSRFYAVSTEKGVPLIMKAPAPKREDDPAFIDNFVLESCIGARVFNAHLVRLVEPPETRSSLYYLSEFIAGPRLSQLIKERAPMAIADAIELFEQFVKAVRAFHRKNTLHLELNPEKIIIGKKGAVIVDFGSGYMLTPQNPKPFKKDIPLTALPYCAPEYRLGHALNEQADQYSLAVMLYQMLTQKLPYGPANANSTTRRAIEKSRYTPASSHNALVPSWLDDALKKALSVDPQKRFAQLPQFVEALKTPQSDNLERRDQTGGLRTPIYWPLLAASGWCAFAALAAWVFIAG
jgi:serine/threonine protein phosphatase PrpC